MLSKTIVTGPSFSRATFISAPKIPVSTGIFSASFLLKYSQRFLAISGFQTFTNDGRFPFLQSAKSVNWLMERIFPFISCTERFIFSFSSRKILKLRIFFASFSASISLSYCQTQTRSRSHFSIFQKICQSTFTEA